MTFRIALASALLVSTSIASADTLSPALESFAPLVGIWNCTGQNTATPQSPAFPFESQFEISPVLGGNWLRSTYTEIPNDKLPMARDNVEFWGVGETGFVSTFFNAFGQNGALSSDGPKDGMLVWAGDIATPNGPMPFEGRIGLENSDTLTVRPTLALPDGSSFEIAVLQCKRSG